MKAQDVGRTRGPNGRRDGKRWIPASVGMTGGAESGVALLSRVTRKGRPLDP